MIDLDASNVQELEGDEEKMKLIFKPEMILQYSEDQVGGNMINGVHVRGNSRKESHDI